MDDDGDIVEDEEEIEDGDVSPIEDNIYEDIRLEGPSLHKSYTKPQSLTEAELLRPLTSAAELPTHPSLSKPYIDQGLPEMIRIAEETLHKEQEILWRLKEMLTQFRGDAGWAPVGDFHTSYDDFIMGDAPLNGDSAPSRPSLPGINGSTDSLQKSVEMADAVDTNSAKAQPADADSTSIDQQIASEIEGAVEVNGRDWAAQQEVTTNGTGQERTKVEETQLNGESASSLTAPSQHTLNGNAPGQDHAMTDAPPGESVNTLQDQEHAEEGDDSESQPQSHRMTTRAQAQRSGSISRPSSAASSIPHIHPIYQFPISAVPDPYCGLPPNEASATTACLLQYVSKQEEIVRGTKELYLGLLRAMRMRKEVMKWAKADGHVGEVSDGEDWYDKEEWGLDSDLVKGREEEEDDAAVNTGKKTRGRRAANTKE